MKRQLLLLKRFNANENSFEIMSNLFCIFFQRSKCKFNLTNNLWNQLVAVLFCKLSEYNFPFIVFSRLLVYFAKFCKALQRNIFIPSQQSSSHLSALYLLTWKAALLTFRLDVSPSNTTPIITQYHFHNEILLRRFPLAPCFQQMIITSIIFTL